METKPRKRRSRLREELEAQTKQLEEYKDHLQRLQAEFDNFRKRMEMEKTSIIRNANFGLIQGLLSILDEFEHAIAGIKNEDDLKGIKMLYENFKNLLGKNGLKAINAVGEKFSPDKHEVVMKEESDRQEDVVIDELQRGYMLNDMVLRFSKVKISGGKKNE